MITAWCGLVLPAGYGPGQRDGPGDDIGPGAPAMEGNRRSRTCSHRTEPVTRASRGSARHAAFLADPGAAISCLYRSRCKVPMILANCAAAVATFADLTSAGPPRRRPCGHPVAGSPPSRAPAQRQLTVAGRNSCLPLSATPAGHPTSPGNDSVQVSFEEPVKLLSHASGLPGEPGG